jgi:hypothetical protein
MLGVMICSCHPSYSGRYKTGDLRSRPAWAKKRDHISKITRAKCAGGMAQGAECLPIKCEATSSKPNNDKKQTNKPPPETFI